jgi:hypothetical protein
MNTRQLPFRLAALALASCWLGVSSASAGVFHVKVAATGTGTGVDWANACTLPFALASAQAGDEVWVMQAKYLAPAGGFVINTRLALYGGFKGTEVDHNHRLGSFVATVLEGDTGVVGNPLDNVPHVVSTTGVSGVGGGPGLLIDGFLIENGYAQTAGANGAGILATQTDLDLSNCFLRHNWAPSANGGGLSFTSYVAGIAPPAGYQLRIKNCEFSDDTGIWGGGIYAERARGAVVNTQFLTNAAFPYGGGAYVTKNGTGSRFDFTNCVFWQNSCSISGTPNQGGGLYLGDSGAGTGGNVRMVNCTLADNTGNSNTDGQAMVVSTNSLAEIYNSILYFNGTGGLGTPLPIFGTVTAAYSDIEGGGYTGFGMISADPLFANHAGGSLHLRLTATIVSPCLDAADYGRLPADDLDVDGDGNLAEPIPLDVAGLARLVDQPTVNDMGVGSTTGAYACPLCTYLDMGAFERP